MPLLTVKIQSRHSSHGGNIIKRRRMGRPSAVSINKKGIFLLRPPPWDSAVGS